MICTFAKEVASPNAWISPPHERNTYKTSVAEKDNQINALTEKLKAYEGYIPPTELEKVKAETEKTYQEKMEALTVQRLMLIQNLLRRPM